MGEEERMWNNGKKRMLTLGRGFEARSRPKCNNKAKSFLSPLLAFAGFVANRRTNTIRDVVFANGRHFLLVQCNALVAFWMPVDQREKW
jgi:hypothetical protein